MKGLRDLEKLLVYLSECINALLELDVVRWKFSLVLSLALVVATDS